jgi:hypothetical protein
MYQNRRNDRLGIDEGLVSAKPIIKFKSTNAGARSVAAYSILFALVKLIAIMMAFGTNLSLGIVAIIVLILDLLLELGNLALQLLG